MQNINTSEQLKAAIQILEAEQYEKGILLKAEIAESFERFNPLNLLSISLEDSKAAPILIDKMLNSTIRIFTGYIADKISGGENGSVFRKISGSLLKSGLSSILSNNSDTFKSISQYIYSNVFKKRD